MISAFFTFNPLARAKHNNFGLGDKGCFQLRRPFADNSAKVGLVGGSKIAACNDGCSTGSASGGKKVDGAVRCVADAMRIRRGTWVTAIQQGRRVGGGTAGENRAVAQVVLVEA